MPQTATPTSPTVNKRYLNRLLARKRELTDSQLSEMNIAIKPVVRDGKSLFFIKGPVDLRSVNYLHYPELVDKAEGLGEHARIITLHTYGYHGFFKPTIAEVLSMIPVDMAARVKAYEVIGPEDLADLTRQKPAIDAGYHAATTLLYS